MGAAAVVLMAFLAVIREGLGTALLFFSAVQGATTAGPLLGILAGIAPSVLIGWLMYASAIRVNLGRFFSSGRLGRAAGNRARRSCPIGAPGQQ
jgi:high-affinity iron transporter